jgi:hypothetical protein
MRVSHSYESNFNCTENSVTFSARDWHYRNADRLTKSDTVNFSKKRLHLRNVSAKDNGVYRCTARNEAGSRSSADNFSLAVAGVLIL